MTPSAAKTTLVVTVTRVANLAFQRAVVVRVAGLTATRPEDVIVALCTGAVSIAVLVFVCTPVGDDLTVATRVARMVAATVVVAHQVLARAVIGACEFVRVARTEVDVVLAVVALVRVAPVPAGDARAPQVAAAEATK